MAATADQRMEQVRRANAELQRRLDEALAQRDQSEAQKAAIAEVLEVINSSPGDLAPVFDAILEKALNLCQAVFGTLWTLTSDCFQPIAYHGIPAAYAAYLATDVPPAGPGTTRSRFLAGERVAHILDLADDEPYRAGEPHRRALVDLGGARTTLVVALCKDTVVLGAIQLYRQHVQAFTEKQHK